MEIKLKTSNHPWRCIEEDGTRCPWLRVARMGTTWTCKIFCEQGDRGHWAALAERDGCLVKHLECVASTVAEEK